VRALAGVDERERAQGLRAAVDVKSVCGLGEMSSEDGCRSPAKVSVFAWTGGDELARRVQAPSLPGAARR
jgi:hypothetical protein